jgi:hypothetical protein
VHETRSFGRPENLGAGFELNVAKRNPSINGDQGPFNQ